MTKRRKIFVIAFAGFLIAGAIYGSYWYCEFWIPNQKMNDLEWIEHSTIEERRVVCHKVIGFQWGNKHDAFLYLGLEGNAESVPLLIKALRRQSDADGGPAACTTFHCATALCSLTGEQFGSRWQDWAQWWDSIGSNLPPEQFYPRMKNYWTAESQQSAPPVAAEASTGER